MVRSMVCNLRHKFFETYSKVQIRKQFFRMVDESMIQVSTSKGTYLVPLYYAFLTILVKNWTAL